MAREEAAAAAADLSSSFELEEEVKLDEEEVEVERGSGFHMAAAMEEYVAAEGQIATEIKDATITTAILANPEVVGEGRAIVESIADEREVTTNSDLLANARHKSEKMFANLGDTDEEEEDDHPMGGCLPHPQR